MFGVPPDHVELIFKSQAPQAFFTLYSNPRDALVVIWVFSSGAFLRISIGAVFCDIFVLANLSTLEDFIRTHGFEVFHSVYQDSQMSLGDVSKAPRRTDIDSIETKPKVTRHGVRIGW